MHLSCCCYSSMPCSSPLLSAATSHVIASMTPHLREQGTASLCQASHTMSESALLLLHLHASSKSILLLQQAMALCPWFTKLPHCMRHYALMPPCLGHRPLMGPICHTMRPWCHMLRVKALILTILR